MPRPTITEDTIQDICARTKVTEPTVLRRLLGLPVRGAALRQLVDAELHARGLAPATCADSNPPEAA